MKGYAYSAATTIGRRPSQQDACALLTGELLDLLVVADGVGGSPGGQEAASAAVEAVTSLYRAVGGSILLNHWTDARAAHMLATDALALAQKHVAALGQGATTLAFVLAGAGAALVVSVGDSCVYIDGNAMTLPHNPVGQPRVLTSSIPRITMIDQRLVQLHPGSTIVVCTDGVYPASVGHTTNNSAAALIDRQLGYRLARQDNATAVMRKPGTSSARPRAVSVRVLPHPGGGRARSGISHERA